MDNIEECICLILEPHYSFYSIIVYEKFIQSSSIKFNVIKDWYQDENLIDYWCEELNKIINTIDNESYKVIFSAHSVPLIALDYEDPYVDQIFDMTRIIVEKLNIPKNNYTNTWQSESDISIPWIKPDVLEYLKKQKHHPENYIFVPISFINEHIEVLFDNDIECRDLCQKFNVKYHRPPMPNYDERFINSLLSTLNRNKNNEFILYISTEHTFNEMRISDTSSKILNKEKDIQMPYFVKKC